MAQQGAALQSYVNDLVSTLDDMRDKKEQLKQQIYEEEEERMRIEKELNILQDRLEKTNEVLVKTVNEKRDLEKTITETENTKHKIVESFRTLLSVLQKESYYHMKHTNE